MPGVIMMGSLFVLFCIEMWLNQKTGGHSHGSATGDEFGGNRSAHPVANAFNNPIRRQNSYDSDMTMAMRDEKRQWVNEA